MQHSLKKPKSAAQFWKRVRGITVFITGNFCDLNFNPKRFYHIFCVFNFCGSIWPSICIWPILKTIFYTHRDVTVAPLLKYIWMSIDVSRGIFIQNIKMYLVHWINSLNNLFNIYTISHPLKPLELWSMVM